MGCKNDNCLVFYKTVCSIVAIKYNVEAVYNVCVFEHPFYSHPSMMHRDHMWEGAGHVKSHVVGHVGNHVTHHHPPHHPSYPQNDGMVEDDKRDGSKAVKAEKALQGSVQMSSGAGHGGIFGSHMSAISCYYFVTQSQSKCPAPQPVGLA
jgi:hypothetical protein